MAIVEFSTEADIRKTLGLVIRNFRRSHNLSQKQLGEKMGSPRSYVSKIESGKTIPTLLSLSKVANALEIPIWMFFTSEAPSEKFNKKVKHINDPFFRQLVSAYYTLDTLDRLAFEKECRRSPIVRRFLA